MSVKGIGRLCTRTDPSGGYTFAYDAFGNRSQSTRTTGGRPFTTAYARDARDRLTAITYPSGTTVAYTRDALGRIATLTATVNGTPLPVITGISYRADGRLATRSDANGIEETRAYDGQGRLTGQRLATASGAALATRSYEYDANGNLTTRTTPGTTPDTTAYGYDTLDRLTGEQRDAETPVTYSHDPNGNRLSRNQASEFAESERYPPESNRISAQETRHLNAAPLPAPTASHRTLVYDDAGRLKELSEDGALKASYTYDANGLRTEKTTYHPDGTATTVLYHYDEQGRLLEESQADGTPLRDYLWLDALPVAQIDHHPATGTITVVHLHTDQLVTPRLATGETGAVVWRWASDAYGNTPPDEDPDGDGIDTVVNLRFPGQYYDAESGLFYNWHRYYDPQTGRYISSDPIGLDGGIETYVYGNPNPITFFDSQGFFSRIFRHGSNFSDKRGSGDGCLKPVFVGEFIIGWTPCEVSTLTPDPVDIRCPDPSPSDPKPPTIPMSPTNKPISLVPGPANAPVILTSKDACVQECLGEALVTASKGEIITTLVGVGAGAVFPPVGVALGIGGTLANGAFFGNAAKICRLRCGR